MQVEGQHELSLLSLMATGARVRNAYPTCHVLRYSPLKGGLIPDVVVWGASPLNQRFIGTSMGMRLISLSAG